MLQETVRGLRVWTCGAPTVVCNEAHRFLVAEQLREIGCAPRAIVLEPKGRNTAPAIALAAHAALAADEGDSLLLVLPADHVIRDTWRFHQGDRGRLRGGARGRWPPSASCRARPRPAMATSGAAAPRAAPTALPNSWRSRIWRARRAYLASGEYYWNSGMFLFRARRYLEELEKFAPDIASVCRTSLCRRHARPGFHAHRCRCVFESCRSESIDYAVMEKTADAVVVPLDAGWSDVGSWASLHEACDAG
jgi:mannose-1-phosphate guanylyltransferase